MFQREKKALFPFILFGLFDPEGLAAEAGRIKSVSGPFSPDRQITQREKRRTFLLFSLGYLTPKGWPLKLDASKE
ncbi:DNA helicase [Rossellomorea aquimaris]|uniref:DNA helicase n=1 Tax=Rossellomorea aquimaris TaxID=189382 RepID=UPI0021CC9167|nr:DNA helicase [Rossellomorea aquimaris]